MGFAEREVCEEIIKVGKAIIAKHGDVAITCEDGRGKEYIGVSKDDPSRKH